jgi:hypothetical protein
VGPVRRRRRGSRVSQRHVPCRPNRMKEKKKQTKKQKAE